MTLDTRSAAERLADDLDKVVAYFRRYTDYPGVIKSATGVSTNDIKAAAAELRRLEAENVDLKRQAQRYQDELDGIRAAYNL